MSVNYSGVNYVLSTGANIRENKNSSSFSPYFVIDECITVKNFCRHYLCTRSALDLCQFGHIGVFNTLRTGSFKLFKLFKLFKRLFLGFLAILTL